MKEPPQEREGFRITSRDLELFQQLAKMKLLTAKQIAALFYVKPPRVSWDPERGRAAAARRIAVLKRNGYLRSSFVPGDTSEKCYFMAPAAAALLGTGGGENVFAPRYLEKKITYSIKFARHDLPLNSFLINLLLLAKVLDDFVIEDYLGEPEMNFTVQTSNDKKTKFKPDAYIRGGLGVGRSSFFELDSGAPEASSVETKLLGHAGFIREGMEELLYTSIKPDFCWILPHLPRVKMIAGYMRAFKKKYTWMPTGWWYLTTVDEMEISSINEGRLTEAPLGGGRWYNEDLEVVSSPLAKKRK